MRRLVIGGCDGHTDILVPDRLPDEVEAFIADVAAKMKAWGGGCLGHFRVEPVLESDCQACGRKGGADGCFCCEEQDCDHAKGGAA